uniref:Uncharacterized protein n=1 Tax=Oryza nivara TaxID=4536 RepID=A0A0E0FLJ1_ORYNI
MGIGSDCNFGSSHGSTIQQLNEEGDNQI